MIEDILENLYRIEIPLPQSPLKALNSYVIKNSERNLMIDTGWNREECKDAMHGALRKLGIDLSKTDFFITHSHSDHLGLASQLITDTSTIYLHRLDADRFNSGIPLNEFLALARLSGYPENELQEVLHRHPGFKFRSPGNLFFHSLTEGDTLRIGEYVFRCVETPGHTRGHMCLYEPTKKILVAGDHILSNITPNIQLWSDNGWNPLKEYLASLAKVYELDIDWVLPGHRSVFRNCQERIRELRHHHEKRLDEILTILKEGKKDAYQVASLMSWDIVHDSWDSFPMTQKWFAVGEAIAHLKYLEERKAIRREREDQHLYFVLNLDGPAKWSGNLMEP